MWPCPESDLPTPAQFYPRMPHPIYYFSHDTKPLPKLLLDLASTTNATTASASSTAALPSVPISSAPPPLPPLESSIPVDTYTLDPCAPICELLFADDFNTCRYLTANHSPTSPPFGLLYANKQTKKAYLVVLPYDFPTLFTYLSRIDTHLRSLPLTSSSSAALTSNPALYSSFANFLSTLPFYYWPAVQTALSRMHRLPRLDVRMDVSVVGGLRADVSENMRKWKEEAAKEMKEEKEAREKEGKQEKKEQHSSDGERMEGRKKKRRRENGSNGEAVAAASEVTVELRDEIKLRRRPVSPEEAEVEWLLMASNTAEERPLLPLPQPRTAEQETKEDRSPWRARGRVAVLDLFELREDELDSAMSEWRDKAQQLLQPYPLLASALPPPPAPPPSASPAKLTLRPRLPPRTTEPCHPIAVMGDFHSYLKSRPAPLREPIDSSGGGEEGGGGLPAFGSPYRRHGRRGMLVSGGMEDVDVVSDADADVNERDVAVVGGELQQSREKGKWKPKPSLKDFVTKQRQEVEEWS